MKSWTWLNQHPVCDFQYDVHRLSLESRKRIEQNKISLKDVG